MNINECEIGMIVISTQNSLGVKYKITNIYERINRVKVECIDEETVILRHGKKVNQIYVYEVSPLILERYKE